MIHQFPKLAVRGRKEDWKNSHRDRRMLGWTEGMTATETDRRTNAWMICPIETWQWTDCRMDMKRSEPKMGASEWAKSSQAMPYNAMPNQAIRYQAIPCHTMLCYAIFFPIFSSQIFTPSNENLSGGMTTETSYLAGVEKNRQHVAQIWRTCRNDSSRKKTRKKTRYTDRRTNPTDASWRADMYCRQNRAKQQKMTRRCLKRLPKDSQWVSRTKMWTD